MVRILVCDDEPRIRELICEYLRAEGYETVEAKDGSAALSALAGKDIQLVILDIMMPFLDWMSCLKEIRHRGLHTPVILLSAKGEEYDKVQGLEYGADDYVTKPFSPRELVARVRAVLSRTLPEEAQGHGTYLFKGLAVDLAGRTLRVEGEEVSVTPKEFDLLVYLVQNRSIALSRERILQKVWNYDFYGEDRTVDTHIKMLRSHLGPYRSLIETVWGVGYKFEAK